jgi:hypothetical protein
MCALAGVDPLSSRLLMNHVVDRDVHDGYITKAALMGNLRKHQETVSAFVLTSFNVKYRAQKLGDIHYQRLIRQPSKSGVSQ